MKRPDSHRSGGFYQKARAISEELARTHPDVVEFEDKLKEITAELEKMKAEGK